MPNLIVIRQHAVDSKVVIAGRVETEFISSFTPYLENQVMPAWANVENLLNIRRI